MAYQVIRQPSGKLAVFSTGADRWAVYDAEPEEIVEWFAQRAADNARLSARETVNVVLAGNPRQIYAQFAMTFEEANAKSAEDGGMTLPGGRS